MKRWMKRNEFEMWINKYCPLQEKGEISVMPRGFKGKINLNRQFKKHIFTPNLHTIIFFSKIKTR